MGANDNWNIRIGHEADHHAVQPLLPADALVGGAGCGLFITESSADGAVIAALAFHPRPTIEPLPGSRVAIGVIPQWQRRGIARAMLDVFIPVARHFGAQALYAWEPIHPNSEAARRWRALGFEYFTLIPAEDESNSLIEPYRVLVDRTGN
jgi:GNAT superfamily N-acetyltransferase